MPQRWTRERRLEHTRNLLLDAAEELFARKGLLGAALEDIADAAGYTRGAIYSHFGAKEELFLEVIERQRQRFLDGFTETIESFHRFSDIDLDELANRWREMSSGTDRAALGYEFTLFLLRNPEARERLAEQRLRRSDRWGVHQQERRATRRALTIPAETLARVILAVNDGITLGSHLDEEDLYHPYLQLVVSSINSASDS